MADTFIRLVDLAGRYKWKYAEAPSHPMLLQANNTGARHLVIVCCVAELATCIARSNGDPEAKAVGWWYRRLAGRVASQRVGRNANMPAMNRGRRSLAYADPRTPR